MLSGLIDKYDPRHLKRTHREMNEQGGESEIILVECTSLNNPGLEKVDE